MKQEGIVFHFMRRGSKGPKFHFDEVRMCDWTLHSYIDYGSWKTFWTAVMLCII